MEGEARHVTDEAALSRAAKAFAVKWQGAWQFTVRDGRFYNGRAEDWPCEVFSVIPARVFAHSKGEPFGATTPLRIPAVPVHRLRPRGAVPAGDRGDCDRRPGPPGGPAGRGALLAHYPDALVGCCAACYLLSHLLLPVSDVP